MPNSCTVTGQISDIFTGALGELKVEFSPSSSAAFRSDTDVVSLQARQTKTALDGSLSVDLVPGSYKMKLLTASMRYDEVNIVVPDQETASLHLILDLPVPAELDGAQQAVLDAQAARDLAQTARDEAIAAQLRPSQTTTGSAQVVDLINFHQVIEVSTPTVDLTFTDTTSPAALLTNQCTMIIKNLYDADFIEFLEPDGVTLPTGSEGENVPLAITFSPIERYATLAGLGDFIHEIYSPKNGDLTKAQYVASVDVSSLQASPAGLCWNSAGTWLFLVGRTQDTIVAIPTTTPGRIGGLNIGGAISIDVSGQSADCEGIAISTDDVKLWLIDGTTATIHQYSFTVAGDPSSGLNYDNVSEPVGTEEADPQDMVVVNGNASFVIVGASGDEFNEFDFVLPDRLDGGITHKRAVPIANETQPSGIAYSPQTHNILMVGPGSDLIRQFTGAGIPFKMTTPPTVSDLAFDFPSFGGSAVAVVVTTDTSATHTISGTGLTQLASPAIVRSEPGVEYQQIIYAGERLQGTGSPSPMDKLLSAADKARRNAIIHLDAEVIIDTGGQTIPLADDVTVVGPRALINVDVAGNAVFENADAGAGYSIKGVTIDAQGNNGEAIFKAHGARGVSLDDCTISRPSTNVLDMLTTIAGAEPSRTSVRNTRVYDPQNDMGHAYLVRNAIDRLDGDYFTYENNVIIGDDKTNLSAQPGAYVEGQKWMPDMLAIQGVDFVRIANNYHSHGGASPCSVTRRARYIEIMDNVFELCQEPLNIGSGVFEVGTNDATTLDVGDLVTIGVSTRAEIDAIIPISGGGAEVRLSAISGEPIGPWPQVGQSIVSDTPNPGVAGTVTYFRPAAGDFVVSGNKIIDCGIKGNNGADYGGVNCIWATRNGGRATITGNQVGNPRGIGNTTHLVSLSNSEAFVFGNQNIAAGALPELSTGGSPSGGQLIV